MIPHIINTARRSARSFAPLVSRATSREFSSLDESLIVTKGCIKRIKSLQKSMGDDDLYLRVVVDSGGCSGFQYVFNMYNKDKDEYITEDDMEFGRDGAKVIVDSGSFEFIKGATVDFEQELIRSAFAVVNNPLSESACGCGSSFAVKNFEANPALD